MKVTIVNALILLVPLYALLGFFLWKSAKRTRAIAEECERRKTEVQLTIVGKSDEH